MAQRLRRIQQSLKVAAETGDINGLYESIKEDPNVLDRIDAIPFVDTPLHTAASAGNIDFAVEILRLKPSFGRKLNPDGLSSLHLALINLKFDTVRRLVKLDKELIRVKGKQGETPLHFIAIKEDINADQQQRVMDDGVNILAEFLFACPDSIEDLTNRDETALHIAVKTKNQNAVEVILGFIRRIKKKRLLLAKKDDKGNTALHMAVFNSQLQMVKILVERFFVNEKNSDSKTALEIDLSLQTNEAGSIVKSLHSAGALKSSSLPDYSLAHKFLNSPQRTLEVLLKLKFLKDKTMTMEQRNIGLVVAVLIATATFQAVRSPPGGVGGGDFNLLTDGGNFNVTITSTKNLFGANTSFINATLSIPTDNPAKRLLFNDVPGPTYGKVFLNFYLYNTSAFVLSMAMIMFFLPFIPFALLHGALYFLMVSYANAFYFISPSPGYSVNLGYGSYYFATLVYATRLVAFLCGCAFKWMMPTDLRRETLVMLQLKTNSVG